MIDGKKQFAGMWIVISGIPYEIKRVNKKTFSTDCGDKFDIKRLSKSVVGENKLDAYSKRIAQLKRSLNGEKALFERTGWGSASNAALRIDRVLKLTVDAMDREKDIDSCRTKD